MATPLHALLYRSTAVRPLSSDELVPLLFRAMRWNAQHGITGRLFVEGPEFSVGAFAQWVEGRPEDVAALFERLREDDRHTNICVLASGPIRDLTGRDGRLYPDWSMSLERDATLPLTLSDFLAAYEDWPERRLVQRWEMAA